MDRVWTPLASHGLPVEVLCAPWLTWSFRTFEGSLPGDPVPFQVHIATRKIVNLLAQAPLEAIDIAALANLSAHGNRGRANAANP